MNEKDEIAKLETELGSFTREVLTLYEELTLLYDVSQIVGSLYNINKITSSVVHSIVEALQVESALVVALDRDKETPSCWFPDCRWDKAIDGDSPGHPAPP